MYRWLAQIISSLTAHDISSRVCEMLTCAPKDYEMLEGALCQPGFFGPSAEQTPLDSILLVELTSVSKDLTTACVSTLGVFPSPPQ